MWHLHGNRVSKTRFTFKKKTKKKTQGQQEKKTTTTECAHQRRKKKKIHFGVDQSTKIESQKLDL